MRPKVSVIISLYRGERYLEKFLENIVEQTWFDQLEFVIDHNDPSELEIKLLKEFDRDHPERLKHLVRETVVPYGASWNRCIMEASSNIVAIWNVDDMRTPGSLEAQVGPILAGEADLVFGNYTEVGGHGSREGRLARISLTKPHLYSRQMSFGPFFMFDRTLCEKVGYLDEQMRTSADLDFAIRLAHHARIKALDDNLGYYLIEHKGLSTRANTKRYIEDTVIGLRYGNLDYVYYDAIPKAMEYEIRRISSNGEWSPVSQFIPDYWKDIKGRALRSFWKGPINYAKLQMYHLQRMKGID